MTGPARPSPLEKRQSLIEVVGGRRDRTDSSTKRYELLMMKNEEVFKKYSVNGVFTVDSLCNLWGDLGNPFATDRGLAQTTVDALMNGKNGEATIDQFTDWWAKYKSK